MRFEFLALAIPIALALRAVTRRRPPARGDSAEVLRWWGLARGLGDPSRPTGVQPAPEPWFDPLAIAGQPSSCAVATAQTLAARKKERKSLFTGTSPRGDVNEEV
jgi:hypothetical protein